MKHRISPTEWNGFQKLAVLAILIVFSVISRSNIGNAQNAATATVYLPIISNADLPPSATLLDGIVNNDGDGNYTVSWQPSNDATSYTLEEDDDGSFASPTIVYTGASLLFDVTSQAPGTYHYRVKAENSAGPSAWSNSQSVVVNVSPTCLPSSGSWSGDHSSSFTVTEDCKVRGFTITVPFSTGTCRLSAAQDIPLGDVGMYTSLAIDQYGNSAISYYDRSNGDLKYARQNGQAWDTQTVDSDGAVGLDTSLALDSAGSPHISYYDSTNSALKYARWTGSSWDIQTVDSTDTVGQDTSLALDTAGNPHISYYDSTNSALKYARWNGSSWDIQTVESDGRVGSYTSLALDTSDTPHISYFDSTNDALKYARWDGANWNLQTVDVNGDVGGYTSLALDAAGSPHISYYDYDNSSLKYVHWNGSAWDTQTVDSGGTVGAYTSLAIGTTGNVYISYYDATNRDLKYASWSGSEWTLQIVESGGDLGAYSSLALESDGDPRVSYHDAIEGDLRQANLNASVWSHRAVDSIIADVFSVSGSLNLIAGDFSNSTQMEGAYIVFLCGNTITIPPSSGSWAATHAATSVMPASSLAGGASMIDEYELNARIEAAKTRPFLPDLYPVSTVFLPGNE